MEALFEQADGKEVCRVLPELTALYRGEFLVASSHYTSARIFVWLYLLGDMHVLEAKSIKKENKILAYSHTADIVII